MSIRFSTVLATVFILISPPAAADQSAPVPATTSLRATDCRFARTPLVAGDGNFHGFNHQTLPRDDLFRPLAAAPLEPRFSGNYGVARFDPDLGQNSTFNQFISILVGLAGGAGIWSWRNDQTCDGVQINIFGGAFSLFAINPLFLVNIDYQGGFSATTSLGNLSGRLRVYHQSSHLGDDFLFANPDLPSENLSFEAVDLLASITGQWWRLYAGGGYFLRADPRGMERITLQAGAEIRSESWERQGPFSTMQWTPIAATDLFSHQARDWGITSNTNAGIELVGSSRRRRFRLLATFLYGYAPVGVFFDEHRITSGGLETQFIY